MKNLYHFLDIKSLMASIMPVFHLVYVAFPIVLLLVPDTYAKKQVYIELRSARILSQETDEQRVLDKIEHQIIRRQKDISRVFRDAEPDSQEGVATFDVTFTEGSVDSVYTISIIGAQMTSRIGMVSAILRNVQLKSILNVSRIRIGVHVIERADLRGGPIITAAMLCAVPGLILWVVLFFNRPY